LDVYQFGVLAWLILTNGNLIEKPLDLGKVQSFPFMQKIIRHCTNPSAGDRPTFPQILYAMKTQPELIPGIDHALYDKLSELYFKTVYEKASSADRKLFDRLSDQPIGSDSTSLVKRARDLIRQGKAADAAELMKKASDAEYLPGMFLYARALLKGMGVPRNENEGFRLMGAAAAKGDADAMYELGSHLLKTNPGEGLHWLHKAHEKGGDEVAGMAMHVIARHYEESKDFPLAREWSQKAAEKGNIAGLIDHARLLLDPTYGETDLELAFRQLDQAIAKGSGLASFTLALMYREGRGCDKDLAQAAYYFERAAELGYTAAYLRLGVLYLPNDSGAPQVRPPSGQDPKARVVECYEKAIQAGDVQAKHNYAVVLFEGKGGIQRDHPRAAKLWQEAAEAGFVASQVRFADCLVNGVGVEKDERQAIAYYRSAASQGNPRAREGLKRLTVQGF
jgi:TPR repeat protein